MNDLILMQEALQEKKIGDIAEQIYEKRTQTDHDCRTVLFGKNDHFHTVCRFSSARWE